MSKEEPIRGAVSEASVASVDLSIIIINWKSVRFLDGCLESVFAHGEGLDFEVLVLDNASYDGCAELIASRYPSVRFLQSDKNLGFAGGNNVAAGCARGRTLLFLNSDTEILPSALQQLIACIDTTPDAGAVGPKLLNSDGSVQTTCLQAFPSILNHFVDTAFLRKRFPSWSLWGNRALLAETRDPVPVDGIVGASLMMRRSVFEEAGGFSTAYFMYAEDMDLCYKVQRLGRQNYYVGCAVVTHHGGQSSSQQSDKQFSAIVMRESLLKFMRLHRGPLYAWLFQVSTAFVALCRLTLLSAAVLLPVHAERKRPLRLSLAKWRRVFRWAVGCNSGAGQPV